MIDTAEYFEDCRLRAIRAMEEHGAADGLATLADAMARHESTRPFMKVILRYALLLSLTEVNQRQAIRDFILHFGE